MLRLPLEAIGGYDLGPILAVVLASLAGAALALALVVWLIWRFAGRARWPLLAALALLLAYNVFTLLSVL